MHALTFLRVDICPMATFSLFAFNLSEVQFFKLILQKHTLLSLIAGEGNLWVILPPCGGFAAKTRPGRKKIPSLMSDMRRVSQKASLSVMFSGASCKLSCKINMLVDYFVLGMIIKSVWHTSCNDAGHSRSDLDNS
jgi:hypothetical protein